MEPHEFDEQYILDQAEYEASRDDHDARSAEPVFYTGDDHLAEYAFTAIMQRLRALSGTITVCDLGGGTGKLLRTAIELLQDVDEGLRSRVRTVLTSLIDYVDPYNLPAYVDQYREASVELPPDDFDARFDVIFAQNSVFFWSHAPDLAAENMYRMLRPGGIVIANFPIDGGEDINPDFDPQTYFEESPLFKVLECETFGNGTTVIVAVKLGSDEGSSV